MRSFLRLAAIPAVLAVVGCLGSTDLGSFDREYGLLIVPTDTTGGQTTTRPFALFIRGNVRLPISVPTTDTCDVLPYDPAGGTGTPPVYIEAGDMIPVTLDGVRLDLLPTTVDGHTEYHLPEGEAFAFVPGDSILFDIPGEPGQFSPMEVKGRTAEVLTMDTIGVPEVGTDLDLSWNTVTEPFSKITVALRYATSGGAPNAQLYCELRDTGSYTIDESKLTGWSLATTGTRSALVTRWRITSGLSGSSVAQLISTYEIAVPVAE